MATANVFLKTSKLNKTGEAPVKILIYNEGTKREKSLGLRVRPDQWDPEKKRVKKNHPQSTRLNTLIAREKSKYLELAMELESGKKSLENGRIDSILSQGGNLDVRELLEMKARELIKIEKVSTAMNYTQTVKRLNWFMAFAGLSQVRVCDIKQEVKYPGTGEKKVFIDAYMQYLREERGNSPGTIRAVTSTIRAVLNAGIRKGLIDPAYMPIFELPRCPARMHYLTPEQIHALRDLEIRKGTMAYTARDMYLLSALGGGLRYGDLVSLQWSNIESGNRLNFRTRKTGSRVHMNLGKIPLEILARYWKDGVSESDFVFPFLPVDFYSMDPLKREKVMRAINSNINHSLKILAEKIGVEHTMSFHTARHTFATMAVSKGMKITVLQKVLGHASITQTEKYWHLLGKDIDEEIERFNGKISELSRSEKVEQDNPNPQVREVPVVRDTQTKMVCFYAEQTARMHLQNLPKTVEGVIVGPPDLDSYAREMLLPEAMRKQTTVRIFIYGKSAPQDDSLQQLETSLNANSLFGAAVKFSVVPVPTEWVSQWLDLKINSQV